MPKINVNKFMRVNRQNNLFSQNQNRGLTTALDDCRNRENTLREEKEVLMIENEHLRRLLEKCVIEGNKTLPVDILDTIKTFI